MNPIESLLADEAVMAELKTLPHVPPTTLRLRARPAVEGLRRTAERLDATRALVPAAGGPGADEAGAGLEAIVLAFGRPTLLVQDHAFATPELDEWRQRLEPLRGPLERTLPSIGRIEIRRLPQDVHVGTGWLVAEDVVVTNRHVAELFVRGDGRTARLAADPFGRDMPVQIDFREEHARSVSAESAIVEVLWVEGLDAQLPDLALLRVRPAAGAALPPPIPLAARLPGPRDAVIAVIGYPAWDYRNDASMMRRLFGDIYGVKRLAPGLVSAAGEGFVFEHDCTTLGGNSGSVVVDAASGQAIGLHFAGEFGVRNLAVRAERIAHRLTELAVRVAVPIRLPRLGDPRPAGAEPEAARRPEDYAQRAGFGRDFIEGVPGLVPDFGELTADLAWLRGAADEHELRYTHFSVWMSAARRLALCTAVNIGGGQLRRFVRAQDVWHLDPRLGPEQQVGEALYRRNHLDRGHLVRRLDPVWGPEPEAREAMDDTFHYTNAAPQHERFNQVAWNEIEDYLLDNAQAHGLRISVLTGPIFGPGDPRYREVELPREFWKVVVMARRTPRGALRPHATAYLLSQADLLGNVEFAFGAYCTWQVPIGLIERRTGIGFAALRPFDPLSAGRREGATPAAQPIRGWRDIVMDAGPADPAADPAGAAAAGAAVAPSTAPDALQDAPDAPDAGIEQPSPNAGDDADVDPAERAPDWAPTLREAPRAWRVAGCLLALRRQVDARAPRRSKASDGTIGDAAHATRASDHNPWVLDGGTGVVTALDITHDPAGGCDADAIAEALRASRDARIKYVIWNRRIASAQAIGAAPAWAWRAYAGRNPHTKHVHVSVRPERGAYDSEAPWRL